MFDGFVNQELPNNGVLFLGGHPNMTKKLRRYYPNWLFLSDEYFNKGLSQNLNIVFYWTGHGSHKLMRFIYSKLPKSSIILYVTSTNIELLIKEMQMKYQNYIKLQAV